MKNFALSNRRILNNSERYFYSMKMWNFSIGILNLLKYYILWIVRNFQRSHSDCVRCLEGKTAIITGGNSGIGYATSVLLASRGCRVIIACRSDARSVGEKITELTGNLNIITKYLDLSKLRTVRDFADDIRKNESKIDILVNNAGMGASSDNGTEDGLNKVMQVNYFGHFLLTHLLVDQLKASGSANVVFLSSLSLTVHNLKYLNYGECSKKTIKFLTNYANSKLLNVLAAQQFGEKLKKWDILVNCADPGIARTPIYELSYVQYGKNNMSPLKLMLKAALLLHEKDVFESAQTTFHLAASRDLNSGDHYFGCKPFIKPDILTNRTFCHKVWNNSEKFVKLSSEEKIE